MKVLLQQGKPGNTIDQWGQKKIEITAARPDFCNMERSHVEGRLQVLVAEDDGWIAHVKHLLVPYNLLQDRQHLDHCRLV